MVINLYFILTKYKMKDTIGKEYTKNEWRDNYESGNRKKV